MLTLVSNQMELRGVENKVSKSTGNVFYILHLEDEVGKHYEFYCASADCFAPQLKKGDLVFVHFEYVVFDKDINLKVLKVEKVGE